MTEKSENEILQHVLHLYSHSKIIWRVLLVWYRYTQENMLIASFHLKYIVNFYIRSLQLIKRFFRGIHHSMLRRIGKLFEKRQTQCLCTHTRILHLLGI